MKKIIIALVAAILATVVQARPNYNHVTPRFSNGPAWHHHGWGHSYGPRYHEGYYHHHHGSLWGRGGRNFWPGLIGGAVGAAVVNAVTQPSVVVAPTAVVTTPQVVAPQMVVAPQVVTQPVSVYQPTQVWVPGQWVHTVGPYGAVRIWQPGHYEVR